MNDIHLGKDNIAEFQANWQEALDICEQHNVQDIIIGGDLWQSRASQTLATLLTAKGAFLKSENKGIYLTIANGNHDKVDLESIFGYNSIFAGNEYVFVVSDWLKTGFTGYNKEIALFVVSYFPENGSFREVYRRIITSDCYDPNQYNILYLHEGIRGGLSTPSEHELPADMFKEFDKVLVGHYHDRKRIPGTNIYYIGASRQHNFGEDEQKGYTLLYDDGSHEFIQNQVNIRYKTIDVSAADVDSLPDQIAAVKNDRTKVRVNINCTVAEAASLDKQALLDAGAAKIELRTEQTVVSAATVKSLEHKFDKEGIKEEYKMFCNECGIEAQMGLKYLDKIQ